MIELAIVLVFGVIGGLGVRKRRHIQAALCSGLFVLAAACVLAVLLGRESSDVFGLLTLRESTGRAGWLAPMVTAGYVLLLACLIGQVRILIGSRSHGSGHGDI